MADATFKHGNPRMLEHTPGSDVDAGDVVLTGDTPRVAHTPLTANLLGALAAAGGVYEMIGDNSIAADKVVYWDVSAGKVSEDDDTGTNAVFGFTVTACAQNGSTCLVRHEPQAAPAA